MNVKTLFLLSALIIFGSEIYCQEAQSFIDKGQSEVQRGNYKEGVALFNTAIEMDTESLDAYVKRAFAFSMLKEYDKAVADYSKLIELNPNFAIAYLSRGSAYNKLERFKEALADFDKVIILDPSNSEAYNNRGWSKKGLGDKEGACSDWKISKKMGNEEAKIILKNNQC